MENNSCKDCKAHSGLVSDVKKNTCEVNMLRKKWDWITKVAIGAFITLSIQLAGIIFIVIKLNKPG